MGRSRRRACVVGIALTVLASLSPPPVWAANPDDDGMLYSVMDDAGDWRIVRSNLDGTGKQVLAEQPNGEFLMPTLSPDRSRIALTPTGLSVISADGGPAVPLSQEFTGLVTWSPDSERVVAVEEIQVDGESIPRLAVYDADGAGSTVLLADNPATIGSIGIEAWAPDGSALLFSGYEGGDQGAAVRSVYRVPVTGGEPVPIPGLISASISPDGTTVFGFVEDGTHTDVVRFSADLLTMTTVHTISDTYAGWYPQRSWSADSSRFGVVATTYPADYSWLVFDRSGALVRTVSDMPYEQTGLEFQVPRLSPDGTVLAIYARTYTAQFQYEGLYLLDLTLSRSCKVTDIYEHGGGLTGRFALDGRTLFIEGHSQLRALDYTEPGGMIVDVDVPYYARIEGFFGTPEPEVPDAVPCPLEPIERSMRIEPGRAGGQPVLRAYVFGIPACENDVPVRLQRRRNGGTWRTIAKTRTDDEHTATFDRPRSGTVRAVAPRVARDIYSCLKTRSNTFRS